MRVTPDSAREQGDRLQPGRRVRGRRDQQVVDEHRRLEAEVLGAPEVGAHLRERRGLLAEREAGQPQPVVHRAWPPARPGPSVRRRRRPGPDDLRRSRRGRGVAAAADDRLPSMRTMPTPGRSPMASAPSAVSAAEPVGASTSAMSASRRPRSSRSRAGGPAPCCRSPSRRRSPARSRRATRGGPSSAGCRAARRPCPTARRCRGSRGPSAPPSFARPIAWSAARPLPQWTISIAMSARDEPLDVVVGQRGRAAVDVADDVGPRLEDDVGADRRSSRRSTGRRCGTSRPCRAAAPRRASARPAAPVLTEPSPISPIEVDARRGHLGEVVLLEAELEDRARRRGP